MAVLAFALLVLVAMVSAVLIVVAHAFGRLEALRHAVDDLRDRVASLELERTAERSRVGLTEPAHALVETDPIAAPATPAAALPPAIVPRDSPEPREPAVASESLESRIGGQWLLYVGIFIVLLGVAYFEKLAFENAWLSETARVLQGALAGALLVYAGARFARAGYRLYGHAMEGGGFAALYLSAYASFNYYQLVSRPAAFAMMVAITAAGVWTAGRQRSQGLAVVAVGGGFLTPFLLPGTADTHVALFGYDAILVGGTALLARRRDWSLVYLTSYLSTLLTIAAWADRFYTPDEYFSTELFLSVFCGMFLYILRQARGAKDDARQIAAMFLWTAPVAYYAASLTILWDHGAALLVWLVLLMTAGAIASGTRGSRIGAIVWTGVALPLLAWSLVHATPRWETAGLAASAGVYAVALFAQLRAAVEREQPSGTDVAWIHANGLVIFAAAYLFIAVGHVATAGTAAALFAGWQAVVGWGLRAGHRRAHATHFAALGLSLVAIAIALQFDGPAVTTGWAAEAFVAMRLGYRENRAWLRIAAMGLFAVAAIRIEWLLFAPAPIGSMVLLNVRALGAAFVVAIAYAIAVQHARRATGASRDRLVAAAIVAAQIVTLSLVTSEIDAYWAERGNARIQEVMRSVAWATYGTALILIGLRRNYAPIRIFAILVLAATVLKVFVVDLSHLERVYRVLSVIGVGVMLLIASYLYQRSRRQL